MSITADSRGGRPLTKLEASSTVDETGSQNNESWSYYTDDKEKMHACERVEGWMMYVKGAHEDETWNPIQSVQCTLQVCSVIRYTVHGTLCGWRRFRTYGAYRIRLQKRCLRSAMLTNFTQDSSPLLVLLKFLASLAELISEMWLRVFKYKWNML